MRLYILLYADDIVLLADSETDLQSLLYLTEAWCKKWRLEINLSKTNIMHVLKMNLSWVYKTTIPNFASQFQ